MILVLFGYLLNSINGLGSNYRRSDSDLRYQLRWFFNPEKLYN